MGATRIYVLAKDTDHPSVDVIRILAKLGVSTTSHMASVSDDVKRQVVDRLKKEDALKPKPVVEEKAPQKPPRPPRRKKVSKVTGGESAPPAAEEPKPVTTRLKKASEIAVEEALEASKAVPEPPVEVAPPPPEPQEGGDADRPTEDHAAPPAVEPATSVDSAHPSGARIAVAEPPRPDAQLAASAAAAKPVEARGAKSPPSAVAAAAEAARAATAHNATAKTQLPPPRTPYRPRPGMRPQGGRPPMGGRHRPQHSVQQPKPAPPAEPPPIQGKIHLSEGVTVKEIAEKLGVKSKEVMRKLLERRIMATINQTLDTEIARQVSRDFGYESEILTFEEDALREHELSTVVAGTDDEKTHTRPPVVTVMGHVDHGKTSLLDAIRSTKVTESESGGITQHIGAYHVDIGKKRVVFLDTPGHEAFTMMRARGAKATDIVVLVVAADDGVMPQTVEAMNHAREAGVPILVAVNKIDKPGANPDRVKQQLADRGLQSEDWGGDVVMVEVSAKQRKNLEVLLEMILLVADMQDLRANADRPASGVVLEAQLDKQRGATCTILVQNGTLKLGDSFIAGAFSGKVRAMIDDRGARVGEADPSSAVEVLGFSDLPNPGDAFQVVDEAKARQIAVLRQERRREQTLAKSSRLSLDHLHMQVATGEVKELPIILKCDVQGSVEVLQDSLSKLSDEKVKLKIIHSAAGAISVSDVLLASASNAIIFGFNVRPERKAQELADNEGVEIRLHTVIYDIANEIKAGLSGLLDPIKREVFLGRAEVRQVFKIPKVGNVAGCFVDEGRFIPTAEARLLRDNVVVWQGKLLSLRRFKADVSEVKAGLECGIGLANYNDVKAGDVIEGFIIEMVRQTT